MQFILWYDGMMRCARIQTLDLYCYKRLPTHVYSPIPTYALITLWYAMRTRVFSFSWIYHVGFPSCTTPVPVPIGLEGICFYIGSSSETKQRKKRKERLLSNMRAKRAPSELEWDACARAGVEDGRVERLKRMEGKVDDGWRR
jgi:hypothetical protein